MPIDRLHQRSIDASVVVAVDDTSGERWRQTVSATVCASRSRRVRIEGLGASALIVYNTLEGIYKNRTYGEKQTDYECDNGASWVDGKGGARCVAAAVELVALRAPRARPSLWRRRRRARSSVEPRLRGVCVCFPTRLRVVIGTGDGA